MPSGRCRGRAVRRPGTGTAAPTGRSRPGAVPSGSSFLMARIAVGAVNKRLHAVLGRDPPERARVGGADRLALVEHGRRAEQQRAVDDVGVADDPADIGGGPVHVAGLGVVDVPHGPQQRDGVPAVVAHDALGLAGGARRVEHVERVGRGDGHRVDGFARRPSARASPGRGRRSARRAAARAAR